MNQSELEANTCPSVKGGKTRASKFLIGFSFTLIENGATVFNQSWSVVTQNQSKRKQLRTFTCFS